MSVNDAKDSSEVNRGESNISVASNIDANFAMQQQNNATISAPENTSMIEHKTTSISDITDPTKRREMDRETRRNARKTRRESRRAERKERHRLRKLTGVLFGGKKKIVWLVLILALAAVATAKLVLYISATEDRVYEQYLASGENDVIFSYYMNMEYSDAKKELARKADESEDLDDQFLYSMSLFRIAATEWKTNDMLEALSLIKNLEKMHNYQKEAVYCGYIKVYSSTDNISEQKRYEEKINELPKEYSNRACAVERERI